MVIQKRRLMVAILFIVMALSAGMTAHAASGGRIADGIYGNTNATIGNTTNGVHAMGVAAIRGSNLYGFTQDNGVWGYAGTDREYNDGILSRWCTTISFNKVVNNNPTKAYGRITGGGVYYSTLVYRYYDAE